MSLNSENPKNWEVNLAYLVQRREENGGEPVPTTVVEILEHDLEYKPGMSPKMNFALFCRITGRMSLLKRLAAQEYGFCVVSIDRRMSERNRRLLGIEDWSRDYTIYVLVQRVGRGTVLDRRLAEFEDVKRKKRARGHIESSIEWNELGRHKGLLSSNSRRDLPRLPR